MVGGPVVLAVIALFALLLWAGFAFVLQGNTNYREMFAVSILASLPNALNSLIAIVTVLVSDPQTHNLNVPSPATLAYFLDSSSAGWLLSLAKSLDVFSLWSLALAGFGGAIVSRVKPARGILMVFSVWLIYLLIKTGIAAATS